MNYAHKALDQCLALRKDSIVLKQKEGKGRDKKGRGGRRGEGKGREKRGRRKKQRRAYMIREKWSAKCF